jgi:transcription elongation GreA/GreB family factor
VPSRHTQFSVAFTTSIAESNFRYTQEVGDNVRVRYLTDDKRIIKITISNSQSDPSHGIVHHRTPIASALLGAEAGDEVEILVGSYIRPAIIEDISKSNGGRAS